MCPGVGAVLALLTLVSPLLVTFHEAAVRHVTCPEHGELVDAPLEAPHPHGHPSTGLPGLFAKRDPSGPCGPGEEHEHLNSLVQGVKGETGIYQFQLVPR
jgi:hypothetical protein